METTIDFASGMILPSVLKSALLQHLHAADVEDGEEDHREQDHADAAHPGHHAAPEERALGQAVDADDDRRAGGGERRGELEVGVGEAEVRGAEHERQAGEGGEDRPGAGGEQEPLAEVEVDLAVRRRRRAPPRRRPAWRERVASAKARALPSRLARSTKKGTSIRPPRPRIEPADDVADGPDFDHGARGSRALASRGSVLPRRSGCQYAPPSASERRRRVGQARQKAAVRRT